MKVRLYEPGKPWRWIDIENDLHALQDVVGGYIEVLTINPKAAIVCNEEGKIRGMVPNRKIYIHPKGYIDTICGPFIICGIAGENFCDAPELILELRIERLAEKGGKSEDGRKA